MAACISVNWREQRELGNVGVSTRDPASLRWADRVMLSPDSAVAHYWTTFVLVLVLFQFIAVPHSASFRTWRQWSPLYWFTDAMYLFDIVIQLNPVPISSR